MLHEYTLPIWIVTRYCKAHIFLLLKTCLAAIHVSCCILCCKVILPSQEMIIPWYSSELIIFTRIQISSGAEGGDVSKGLFVDEGVYTKNRNFRLYLSSKFGKETALRAKDSYNQTSDSRRAIFFDTLGNIWHILHLKSVWICTQAKSRIGHLTLNVINIFAVTNVDTVHFLQFAESDGDDILCHNVSNKISGKFFRKAIKHTKISGKSL